MAQRIDIWLVERMGIPSRAKAQALIKSGSVFCNGRAVSKAGMQVGENDNIKIISTEVLRYVSRGGLKLDKAIECFGLDFTGAKVIDIGSSTGGFTDCALQHGAKSVIAIDVGTGVMEPSLAADPRVELHEQTDIRDFPLDRFKDIDFVVCDVSFISLASVISPICGAEGDFEMILLIKPQFECGREAARRHKGIIRDTDIHKGVINKVIGKLKELSFDLKAITYSPVCGGDGNIEYIAEFARNAADIYPEPDIDELVEEAFRSLKRA